MAEELEARAAAEARHRLANSFQLVAAVARMRGQRATAQDVRAAMAWVADVVAALGGLERHRRGAEVDFSAYLSEMALAWKRRLEGPGELTVLAQPMALPDQAASTLALIAHELVANAIRHGGVGTSRRIEVGLRRLDGAQCELTVRDDGPGLVSTAADGFGMWLVRSIAPQVRGRLELSSGPGLRAGFVFENVV